jgi:hypothetical protein
MNGTANEDFRAEFLKELEVEEAVVREARDRVTRAAPNFPAEASKEEGGGVIRPGDESVWYDPTLPRAKGNKEWYE